MTEVHPWLQVYLAAGIVTLVISAGLALRERWRRRGDPDSLISLLEPPDPRRRTLWYRVRSSVLTPVLVALFLVLLWPAVPWMKFQDVRHARRAAREEAERVFQVHPSHLLERCSVDEAEARETVRDPLNAVPAVPFGHLNPMWSRLKAQMQAGDQLWAFEAQWQDELSRPDRRAGYVIWRGGQPVAHILTVLERLEGRAAVSAGDDVRIDDDEIQVPAFLRKDAD